MQLNKVSGVPRRSCTHTLITLILHEKAGNRYLNPLYSINLTALACLGGYFANGTYICILKQAAN